MEETKKKIPLKMKAVCVPMIKSRQIPYLSFSEEKKFLSLHGSELALVEELTNVTKLYSDEKSKMLPRPWEDDVLFNKYHPEAENLRINPNKIRDDYVPPVKTCAIFGDNGTNDYKYWIIRRDWDCGEWKTTREGIDFQAHEKREYTLFAKINTIQNKINFLSLMTTIPKTSIIIDSKGIEFVDNLITREKKIGPNQIRGLVIPLNSIRFKICRDLDCDYSEKGDALLFKIISENDVCGVIYKQSPEIWLTCPKGQESDVLSSNVVDIFENIYKDPKKFFSEIGKKSGICMFCGQNLTDKWSIENGYGKICGQRHGW